MPHSRRSLQARNSLTVQVEQPYRAVVVRDGDDAGLRHRQPVDRRVRSDGRQRRAHVAQLPNLHRLVVRAGDDFVVLREDRGRDGLGVTLKNADSWNLRAEIPKPEGGVARRCHNETVTLVRRAVRELVVVSRQRLDGRFRLDVPQDRRAVPARCDDLTWRVVRRRNPIGGHNY